jgi:hypothetical protein
MKKLTAMITLFFFTTASLAGTEPPVVKSADDLLVRLERVFSDTNWKSKTEREAARKTLEALGLAYIKGGCEGSPEACAKQMADAMAKRGYPQTGVDSTRETITAAIAIANDKRLAQNQKQIEINRLFSSMIHAVPTGEAFDPSMIGFAVMMCAFAACIGIPIYAFKTGKKALGWTFVGIDIALAILGGTLAGGS